MASSNWLITGTTKGIGRGIVTELLKRPQTTVFAGVRDPQAEAATSLKQLEVAKGSKLVLLKVDATSESDNKAAVSIIKDHGVEHLDVVIANAGLDTPKHATLDVPETDFLDAFKANTLGPIFLFQATQPLLSAASNPRFFVTTSLLGSLEVAEKLPVPLAPYGISKAGINWFLRKMHGEFPKIAFVPIHPGLVDTALGGPFSRLTGMPAISVDESVKGYLQQIDNATRETVGGKFIDYTGAAQPW